VRNLVLGYLTSTAAQQVEVLPVLATVLGMSPEERVRSGVTRDGTIGGCWGSGDFWVLGSEREAGGLLGAEELLGDGAGCPKGPWCYRALGATVPLVLLR
jgi:hypothetical protein